MWLAWHFRWIMLLQVNRAGPRGICKGVSFRFLWSLFVRHWIHLLNSLELFPVVLSLTPCPPILTSIPTLLGHLGSCLLDCILSSKAKPKMTQKPSPKFINGTLLCPESLWHMHTCLWHIAFIKDHVSWQKGHGLWNQETQEFNLINLLLNL